MKRPVLTKEIAKLDSMATNIKEHGSRGEVIFSTVVVVCGMPRSGTTAVQQLLNSHDSIVIYDEFPLYGFDGLREFLSNYKEFLTGRFESWRGLFPQSRRAELVVDMWRTVSRPELYRRKPDGVRVVGMKTPRAALDAHFYAEIFQGFDLKYIYCLRHPYRVLQSLYDMPWMVEDLDDCVAQVRDLYARSFHQFCALEQGGAEQVMAVQVDRAGGSPQERVDFCQRLLRFLGEDVTAGVREYSYNWPRIDHWMSGRRLRAVPRGLLLEFGCDPVVREIASRFGYDLSSSETPIASHTLETEFNKE